MVLKRAYFQLISIYLVLLSNNSRSQLHRLTTTNVMDMAQPSSIAAVSIQMGASEIIVSLTSAMSCQVARSKGTLTYLTSGGSTSNSAKKHTVSQKSQAVVINLTSPNVDRQRTRAFLAQTGFEHEILPVTHSNTCIMLKYYQ